MVERVRADAIRSHPAYRDTVERYRIALLAWQYIHPVAMVPLGFTVRQYCDAFSVSNFPPFTWSAGSTAGQEWTQAHADAAFEEAKRGDA